MSLEKKIIKYAKKREKVEMQIFNYKNIRADLQKEIELLELEENKRETKNVLNIAKDALKRIECKINESKYKFSMLSKALDFWHQRLESGKAF